MDPHPRYRFEADLHSIDVRVENVEQLFDNRDPAPYRARDLDTDLVDYLVDAAEDLYRHGPFRIVLWIAGAPKTDGIDAAFKAQFDYELARIQREGRRRRGIGAVAFVLAAMLLAILLTAAHFIATTWPGNFGEAVREGLVICSWVVLWRPVDIIVYDWIPPRRRRKLFERLRDAPLEIRAT